MQPPRPLVRGPRIDEPWGFVHLCGECGREPAELRAEGDGISCARHQSPGGDPSVPLEQASREAWPDLTTAQRFDRVGTAIVVLRAVSVGAWYFSREGLGWAWALWDAAVRARGGGGSC